MSILRTVKQRLGIYYSEPAKDSEVKQMLSGAVSYFKGAGWDFTTLLQSLEAKEKELQILGQALDELTDIEEPDSDVLSQINEVRESLDLKLTEILHIESQLSLPVEAIVLYCKMAHPTSAFQLTNHPVLTSMIAQGRSGKDGNI